jgi:mono/diheme cytochrome c family protein/uncharacterized membrane protein
MTEFIGHFHPVLVHLPIGILLIAAVFQLLIRKEKYKSLHSAIGVSLFLGMLSAVASCISGFMLSQTGDYDAQLVSRHQWLGIATACISLLAYYFYKKKNGFLKWMMLVMAVLIIITGHLGGSLTHGSGYLFNGLSDSTGTSSSAAIKPVANVQEAMVYADVIQPIFQTKCYSCHGANKQKGKLRLDEQSLIVKGGKNGPVFIAGKEEESELIKRILLSAENENHMPPKEKPQLSQHEIDLLRWWVSSGAAFDKKVKDIAQTDKIKPVLLSLQSVAVKEVNKVPDIPEAPVKKADEAVLLKLKALGVVVIPVSQNSHYLSANFITAIFTDKDLQLLEPLKEQLIWLKLGNTKITDSALVYVSKLTSLTKLYAENTAISDNGLAKLTTLSQLQYANITGTKVTATGILQLKDLKSLQQLFLYKTAVTGNDYAALKKIFPAVVIDTGGYKVQMLATDTMLVKPPLGN